MSNMIKYKKILLPVITLIITLLLVMLIVNNPPTSKRVKTSKAPQMTVETMTITPQTYSVVIDSFGTVKPRTESVLFAQVSGQIIKVSPQFRAGGFFESGDILVQLDDRDHRADVKMAQSNLMTAQQNLQEEEARGTQAKADWNRLGSGKTPSALVLRTPQYEAAKAQVLSAEAQLAKAQLALERTKILAPYAGRVLKKNVDIGQVISSNTQLANLYAVDYVEIRLPIKNKDLPLMQLPEEYRNASIQEEGTELKTDVVISSDLMGEQVWQGKIVRTESAIDETSQQLYVVAQIIRPYDKEYNPGAQIKMGQYVTAKITGREVENAIVIPSSAIYQGSYVYIVQEGLLMRKDIQLGWQNGKEAIVTQGLMAGDELVLTSLGQVSSGTPVAIADKNSLEQQKEGANSSNKANKDPNKRLKKLEKIAAERGITVEALMIEREQNQANRSHDHNATQQLNKVNKL